MELIQLPSRKPDDASLKTDSYRSQSGYWTEGAAYVIDEVQAETLREDARRLLEHFDLAMDYVVNNFDVLEKFIFTGDTEHDAAIRRLVAASWRHPLARAYVLDRWDIAWDGKSPFKILERNFGHLGLIVGTGPVQEDYVDWLSQQEGYGDVQTFGSLQKHVVQAFREVAEECALVNGSHLGIVGSVNQDDYDPGMIQAGRLLASWAKRAGFIPDFIEAHYASFESGKTIFHRHFPFEQRLLMDKYRGYRLLDVVQTFIPTAPAQFNFVNSDSYCRSIAHASTEEKPLPHEKSRSLQPFWGFLAGHKGMLAVMHQLYPDHPNLLPTSWGVNGLPNEKRIVKHVLGMQGLGSTIWMANGEKETERSDRNGALRKLEGPYGYVTQAYCDAVKGPNGGFRVLNLFTANRQPAALGVRSAPNAFVGGDDTQTRFSGVIVRPTNPHFHPGGVA